MHSFFHFVLLSPVLIGCSIGCFIGWLATQGKSHRVLTDMTSCQLTLVEGQPVPASHWWRWALPVLGLKLIGKGNSRSKDDNVSLSYCWKQGRWYDCPHLQTQAFVHLHVCPGPENSMLERDGLWVLWQCTLFPAFTFCFIFAMNLNYSNNQEGKCY